MNVWPYKTEVMNKPMLYIPNSCNQNCILNLLMKENISYYSALWWKCQLSLIYSELILLYGTCSFGKIFKLCIILL